MVMQTANTAKLINYKSGTPSSGVVRAQAGVVLAGSTTSGLWPRRKNWIYLSPDNYLPCSKYQYPERLKEVTGDSQSTRQ